MGPGDLTAQLVPAAQMATATIIARDDAVICGQAWVDAAFRQTDPSIDVRWELAEGAQAGANDVICRIHGPARGMLTAERTALNFLQTLSGTATAARTYVEAVAGTGSVILDTRKTLPGMRLAQKYAVRCGGATNHRIGLFDAILIKENHIVAAGSIAAAAEAAQSSGVTGGNRSREPRPAARGTGHAGEPAVAGQFLAQTSCVRRCARETRLRRRWNWRHPAASRWRISEQSQRPAWTTFQSVH